MNEIGFIDVKYINLIIVFLKHIQFISAGSEPVSFMYDWQICKFISLC